jgi:phosphatidate cytidylyltransferase
MDDRAKRLIMMPKDSSNDAKKGTSTMLRWRLLLGTLLIAALVVLCAFDAMMPWEFAGTFLLPVALIAALLATREVLDLAAVGNMRPLRWPVYVGNLLIVAGGWASIYEMVPSVTPEPPVQSPMFNAGAYALGWPFFGLVSAVLLSCLGEMCRYRKPGGNMANLAAAIFTLIYVGFMLSFAVQMRMWCGVEALVSWIIVVKMGDIGAYTVGRLIGRHKMAPLLSPGKTMEGAVGALAFSCLGSWLTFRWLVPVLPTTESFQTGPWWGWIVFGLLVGTAGMVGDLFESMLKRDVGRKDSSDWLPGFGGVLDILDSLLLSAPVAWFCWVSGLVGR